MRPQNSVERLAQDVRFPGHRLQRPSSDDSVNPFDVAAGTSNIVNINAGPQEERVERVFYTTGSESPPGVYKMLLINTDRQKTKIFEIKIDDARGSGFFR